MLVRPRRRYPLTHVDHLNTTRSLNTLGDLLFGLTRGTASCALQRRCSSISSNLEDDVSATSGTTTPSMDGNSPRHRHQIPRNLDYGLPVTLTTGASPHQLGEVAVVAIRKLECNVAVKRACSPSPRGPLSLKPTTGPYRTLASRSSHRALPCEQALSRWSRQALSTRIPAIVVDSRAEATYLRPPSGVLHSQTTLPSTFALALDLRLCYRPTPFATDLRLTQSIYKLRHTLTSSPFDRPRPSGARSCPRQVSVEDRVLVAVEDQDLRGKHNARRFLGSFLLEDDDHRILRGKYKRREGKATQVYRKKWVISRWLASITAARLIASITAACLLVPRPPQNPV
ncbi:hypothetical protein FB107DRAFT_252842, partial [Schizophyllum commune]